MVEFTTLIAKPIPLLQFVFFSSFAWWFPVIMAIFTTNKLISVNKVLY